MPRFFQQLPKKSFTLRATMLGLTVLTAAAIILPIGYFIAGHRAEFSAGAMAAGVCLVAALLALGTSHLLQGPQHLLASVAAGMMIRMGIPLVAALVVRNLGGPLADAGFLYYLVVFYPVTLTAETILSLPSSSGKRNGEPSAHDSAE